MTQNRTVQYKLLSNQCFVLVAWQICAIVLCIAGSICALIVQEFGATIPIFMLSMCYLLIFLTNVWWWPKSEVSWLKYLLIAFSCFAGDWTGVMAYNTTSLASAMLLVTTVVFWVAPFSFLVYGRRLSKQKFFAILVATAMPDRLSLAIDGWHMYVDINISSSS